ncbi:MAG: putative metal-binding motif-containing protein [Myxococcales bacterium]|nr:putative metal-binding motif-containing protein [Myxococcales bacterium]
MNALVVVVAVILAASLNACVGDIECPHGSVRVGERCILAPPDASDAGDGAMTDGGADGGEDAGADGGADASPDAPSPDACSPESCNGRDDDCDGNPDDDFGCAQGAMVSCTTSCGSTGVGRCTDRCEARTSDECGPSERWCYGRDDDCDGNPDDGFGCAQGAMVSCTTRCGSTGMGRCTDRCESPSAADCTPPAETCNGRDDDCDGTVDNGVLRTFYRDSDGDGYGDRSMTRRECTAPAGYVANDRDCNDACATCHPAGTEACDGLDNDCDSMPDETFECVRGSTTSCTTSCGTTGSGTCSSSCTRPPAASCTPPAEMCNRIDDDCDGLVDDGVQRLSTAYDIGSATRIYGVTRTSTGFAALYATSSHLVVRRFDAAGMPGAAMNLSAVVPWTASLWHAGTRLLVTWAEGTELVAAVVDDTSLTLVTPRTSFFGSADGFEAWLHGVVLGSQAVFVWNRGATTSDTWGVARSFPSLAGTSSPIVLLSGISGPMAVTTDGGARGLMAVSRSGSVMTFTLTTTPTLAAGYGPSILASSPQAVSLSVLGGTSPTLAVTWWEDPSGTTSDRVRFALLDLPLTGAPTLRDTITILNGSFSSAATAVQPLHVTAAGGRYHVSALAFSTGTASVWRRIEVIPGTPPSSTLFTVTSAADEWRGTALSGHPTGGVLFCAARNISSGTSRCHHLGCD